MSISEGAIKVIGLVVALLGLGLVLASVSIDVGPHIPVVWYLELVIGLLMIGAGAYIIRGGKITT